MTRNPFNGGSTVSQDKRIIDLHLSIPSLDWSLYPKDIIEKHEEYRSFLEKEAIKAMKKLKT